MIFSDKIYKRPVAGMILDGTKCQTRRLVKKGEWNLLGEEPIEKVMKAKEDQYNSRLKWQVGRDYCVSWGRGHRGLFYCPICFKDGKKEYLLEQLGGKGDLSKVPELCWHEPYHTMKPLRIKLTGIHKERLLDISEEDVKKEGFFPSNEKILVESHNTAKWNFLYAFARINLGKKLGSIEGLATGGTGWLNKDIENIEIETKDEEKWNPEVWVISFCVKK